MSKATYAERKHSKVYAVALELNDEVGYATVAAIRKRLEELGDDPAVWDPMTPATMTVRNALNALSRDRFLSLDDSHGELRWAP